MKKKLAPTGRRGEVKGAEVRAAAWLCPTVLLVIHAGAAEAAPAVVLAGDVGRRVARCPARHTLVLGPGSLALSLFVLPGRPAAAGAQLLFPTKEPVAVQKIAGDLKNLLRQHLAPLETGIRQAALAALTALKMEPDGCGCAILAENLALAREALRHRLPEVQITSEVCRGAHVDHLFAIDDRAFYLRGWAAVAARSWVRFTAVSPEGERMELADQMFWRRRPDIDQLYQLPHEEAEEVRSGFLSYFEVPARSALRDGWILEVEDDRGEAFEVRMPKVRTEMAAIRQTLVGDLGHERLPQHELRARHVLPAITRLQERHQRALKIECVCQYGRPPAAPEVSVVIPLYRRVDFLEHQLAQWVHDPELRGADLIYVLDSPELADGLRDLAAELFELYRVPFRLAVLRSNAGYAGANNLGAGLARGRRLLLLNSDILPDRPGWLGRLASFHASRPQAGAVGAKLLFEDDTLQHAGLYFRRAPVSGLWENQHYYKGLDRHLPLAGVTRQVPSVSAACLMVDRGLFKQLGGLRGVYVQGDYEDSDLCLRLREAGREIWYLPEVELYHLEGQSYASEDRARNLALNRWLHTWFWGPKIEALMQRPEFSPAYHE